ncbi:hypothetical protein NMW39_27200, partial [Escherichia coli]|uniref:hypothetical protein n=1 Tax=Escherichia coli TaxID=562 RepID=UPI0022451672
LPYHTKTLLILAGFSVYHATLRLMNLCPRRPVYTTLNINCNNPIFISLQAIRDHNNVRE